MEKWVGKVAVVTGASAGIGENVAQKLVQEGMKVVGIARRVELVEKLASKLSGNRGKLYALKCDVSQEDDVKKAFEWIVQNVGPVAVLVNNAGTVRNDSFIDGDPKLWKNVMEINIFGTTLCTQQAVQQMKKAGIDGHIININSIAGHKVIDSTDKNRSTNIYSSTKYAITAYTEVMRQELRNQGLKIKITSVSPGLVDTEIFKAGNVEGMGPEVMKQIPHLLPEDITDGIIYALSTKPHVQVHELMIKPLGEPF